MPRGDAPLCPTCAKAWYPTAHKARAAAALIARTTGHRRMRAYPTHGGWHVTSTPPQNTNRRKRFPPKRLRPQDLTPMVRLYHTTQED